MKKIICFILIISTLVILSLGCGVMYDGTNLDKIKNIDFNEDDCKELAKMLIPNIFFLKLQSHSDGNWILHISYNRWKDSSDIIGKNNCPGCLGFRQGEEIGENIDYYYSDVMFLEQNLKYKSKQIISEDGIIKGNREFMVENLIIKPIGTKVCIRYEPFIPERCMTYNQIFEIINFTITDCNWVSLTSNPKEELEKEIILNDLDIRKEFEELLKKD